MESDSQPVQFAKNKSISDLLDTSTLPDFDDSSSRPSQQSLDSSSLSSSLNTSELRQQLSNLHVDGTSNSTAVSALVDNTSNNVTCASELLAVRRPPAPMGQHSIDVQKGLPKPKIYRPHRRKQEFIVLHSSPEKEIVKLSSERLSMSTESSENFTTNCTAVVEPCEKRLENYTPPPSSSSLSESGFGTFLGGLELNSPPTSIVHSPMAQTPTKDEDVNQMLFTPFKSGTPWLSPIGGGSLVVGGVIWNDLMSPTATGEMSARTSTPFHGLERTPEDRNCPQWGDVVTPLRSSTGGGHWSSLDGASTPLLNKMLCLSNDLPEDFANHSFARILLEMNDDGIVLDSSSDINMLI